MTSPYVYDWRPLSLFIVLTTIGVACALFRASERQRQASALAARGPGRHVTVFCMLYLAVILSGGGDFVYRYFSAAQVAAACLAGTCFGYLFRNPTLQRAATIIVGMRSPTGPTAPRRCRPSVAIERPGAGQDDATVVLQVAPLAHLDAHPALVAVEHVHARLVADQRREVVGPGVRRRSSSRQSKRPSPSSTSPVSKPAAKVDPVATWVPS